MPDLRQLAETAIDAEVRHADTYRKSAWECKNDAENRDAARDALFAAIDALDSRRCATCRWVRVQSEVLTCGLADATDGIVLAEAPMVAQGYRQQPAWLVVLPTHGCREWSANEGATRECPSEYDGLRCADALGHSGNHWRERETGAITQWPNEGATRREEV